MSVDKVFALSKNTSYLGVDGLVIILQIVRFPLNHKCYSILFPLFLSHLKCDLLNMSENFLDCDKSIEALIKGPFVKML